ncbi:MAG TPA: hypothetical protein VFX60_05260 [Micromonospora sp.]|nr:hypothetical protein [Micromonospora sp.]
MPATTQRPMVVAALHVVAVLGCVSLLPANSTAAPPAGVTVGVAAGGKDSPTYRIEVHNATNTAVDTTVRQELPRGATIKSISEGGQVNLDGTGSEVAWRLHLPAHSTTTLQTTLIPAHGRAPLAAPACAFAGEGVMAYHCATAVWGLTGEVRGGSAWWRNPLVSGGVGAALLILAVVALWWRARRKRNPASAHGGRLRAILRRPALSRRARLKPAAPTGASPAPRRAPPTWRVVSFAALLLFATIALITWIGGARVVALEPNAESTRGAWVGTVTTGEVGRTMRDSSFEFTVYRLACSRGDQADQNQCVATIGLRNVSDANQPWYAGLQRAYLPDGSWVTTDEAATRAANGGHDIFAHPIPAGGRLLAPLVFTIQGATAPEKIELRSAVFSAGVAVAP